VASIKKRGEYWRAQVRRKGYPTISLDSARQWWASRCSWPGAHRGAASNDTPTETFG